MKENRDYHPLVSEWLTSNGYTYEHEVVMPDHGRVDFMAERDGETLLVECKPFKGISAGIMQVIGYRAQVPGSLAAIAVDPKNFEDSHQLMCDKYDVMPIFIALQEAHVEQDTRYILPFQWFLKRQLQQRGVSGFEFAKSLGLDVGSVNRLLRANAPVRPGIEFLGVLSKAIDVPFVDLVALAYPEHVVESAMTFEALQFAQMVVKMPPRLQRQLFIFASDILADQHLLDGWSKQS